ncbi:MAG: TGS domain-containing protein [Candidatus Lokiarchaeota archaeon]|nr:TGS domain-containing protein [Candidatus Lokiarchaeota archaeon]
MSSNIGADAKVKYQEYLDAGSLEQKIKLLGEFISLVPKHKGTEKIIALNKSRIAKMKRELEDRQRQLKTTQKVISPFSIKKEGIQIIMISAHYTPGVGKTSLLNYLTGAAKEKIGKFTALPEIGIYHFNNIRFQIVEMPSIMKGASEGIGNGKEILSQLRSCDLICLCVDLTRPIEEQMTLLVDELTKAEIRINIPPPPLTVQKTGSNKIQVLYLTGEAKKIGDIEDFTEKVKEIVRENGIRNAIIKILGLISLDDLVDALTPSVVYKQALIIATKGDLPYTEEPFDKLEREYLKTFPKIMGISVQKQNFPKNFGELILKYLKKIRIYTMSSARRIAEKPLIMDEDSTIKDAAIKIHKSFFESFEHAVVIREGARQKRKKVGLDYILKDGDIIEIHTT